METHPELGERIIALMQQYMTGDQVARIVTMPGRQWINYDADFIQGEFDYSVAAGSTEPMNETFRRQSALQLVDSSMPFLQMGVANPYTLYMHILQKGFGIQNAAPFLMTPPPDQQQGPPQPGDPTAQPQEMQAPDQGPPGGAVFPCATASCGTSSVFPSAMRADRATMPIICAESRPRSSRACSSEISFSFPSFHSPASRPVSAWRSAGAFPVSPAGSCGSGSGMTELRSSSTSRPHTRSYG